MFIRFFSVGSFMPREGRSYYSLIYTPANSLTLPDGLGVRAVTEHAARYIILNAGAALVGYDVDCDCRLRCVPVPTAVIPRPYATQWLKMLWQSPYRPVWDTLPNGVRRLVYRSQYSAQTPPVLCRRQKPERLYVLWKEGIPRQAIRPKKPGACNS